MNELGVDSNIDAAEIATQIGRLRDEVGTLQLAVAERKRPWYRQLSTVVSLIALVFSIVTGIHTIRGESERTIREKHTFLVDIIKQLVSLRGDNTNSKINSLSGEERQSLMALAAAKQTVLLSVAESLIADIGASISSSEYNVLAAEAGSGSDFVRAKEYLEAGVRVSTPGLSRSLANRAIAEFYFQPGPFQNPQIGRTYFTAATGELNGADPYTRYQLGQTFADWGLLELWMGSAENGCPLAKKAADVYDQLPPYFQIRGWASDDLKRNLAQAPGGTGCTAGESRGDSPN